MKTTASLPANKRNRSMLIDRGISEDTWAVIVPELGNLYLTQCITTHFSECPTSPITF